MERQMLSVEEVAEVTGLRPRTIRRHVAAGNFPQPIRINKRVVKWNPERISAWVRRRADAANKAQDQIERVLEEVGHG